MGEGDDGGPSWEEMTVGIVRATEGETLAQTRRQLEPNAMMEYMQKNAMLRKGEQARERAAKARFLEVVVSATEIALVKAAVRTINAEWERRQVQCRTKNFQTSFEHAKVTCNLMAHTGPIVILVNRKNAGSTKKAKGNKRHVKKADAAGKQRRTGKTKKEVKRKAGRRRKNRKGAFPRNNMIESILQLQKDEKKKAARARVTKASDAPAAEKEAAVEAAKIQAGEPSTSTQPTGLATEKEAAVETAKIQAGEPSTSTQPTGLVVVDAAPTASVPGEEVKAAVETQAAEPSTKTKPTSVVVDTPTASEKWKMLMLEHARNHQNRPAETITVNVVNMCQREDEGLKVTLLDSEWVAALKVIVQQRIGIVTSNQSLIRRGGVELKDGDSLRASQVRDGAVLTLAFKKIRAGAEEAGGEDAMEEKLKAATDAEEEEMLKGVLESLVDDSGGSGDESPAMPTKQTGRHKGSKNCEWLEDENELDTVYDTFEEAEEAVNARGVRLSKGTDEGRKEYQLLNGKSGILSRMTYECLEKPKCPLGDNVTSHERKAWLQQHPCPFAVRIVECINDNGTATEFRLYYRAKRTDADSEASICTHNHDEGNMHMTTKRGLHEDFVKMVTNAAKRQQPPQQAFMIVKEAHKKHADGKYKDVPAPRKSQVDWVHKNAKKVLENAVRGRGGVIKIQTTEDFVKCVRDGPWEDDDEDNEGGEVPFKYLGILTVEQAKALRKEQCDDIICIHHEDNITELQDERGNQGAKLRIVSVFTTWRLLQHVPNEEHVHIQACADGTFNVMTTDTKVFALGCNDANSKYHPWCLVVAPEETTEAFKVAFAAVFKFRPDFPTRIVLFLADGSQAIETGFYDALTTALNKDKGAGTAKLSIDAVKRMKPRQFCWAHFLRHFMEQTPFNQIPKTKKGIKAAGESNEDVKRECINDLTDLHYAPRASTFKRMWNLFLEKWGGTPPSVTAVTASSTSAAAAAAAAAGAGAAAAPPAAAAAAAAAGGGGGGGRGGAAAAASGTAVARQRIAEAILAIKSEYGPQGRLGNWSVFIKNFLPFPSSNQGQEKSFDILKGPMKKRRTVARALVTIFRNLRTQSCLRDPECREFKLERRYYALLPTKTDLVGSKYRTQSQRRWNESTRLQQDYRLMRQRQIPVRIYCFDAKSENGKVDMPSGVLLSDFQSFEVYVRDVTAGNYTAMTPAKAAWFWKKHANGSYETIDEFHMARKSAECAVLVQSHTGLWTATCTCDDFHTHHYCALTDMLLVRKVPSHYPTLENSALSTRQDQKHRNEARRGRDRRDSLMAAGGDRSPSPKKQKGAASRASQPPSVTMNKAPPLTIAGAGGIFSFSEVTEDTDDNSVPRRAIEDEGRACGKCGSTFTEANGEQVECRICVGDAHKRCCKVWEKTDTETEWLCHGCWVINGCLKEPVANHVNLASAMLNMPRASQLKLQRRARAMTGTTSRQSVTEEQSSTSKRSRR